MAHSQWPAHNEGLHDLLKHRPRYVLQALRKSWLCMKAVPDIFRRSLRCSFWEGLSCEEAGILQGPMTTRCYIFPGGVWGRCMPVVYVGVIYSMGKTLNTQEVLLVHIRKGHFTRNYRDYFVIIMLRLVFVQWLQHVAVCSVWLISWAYQCHG